MKFNSSEKGQALIIIAFAAIGLFAFAALAIDGSMVFSDRRHAQNAADTAVLDAALSKTRGGTWEQEGLDRASESGFRIAINIDRSRIGHRHVKEQSAIGIVFALWTGRATQFDSGATIKGNIAFQHNDNHVVSGECISTLNAEVIMDTIGAAIEMGDTVGWKLIA